MGRTKKCDMPTPEQVAEALNATGGLVYMAAEKLGISWRTVYRYGERHALVKEAMAHQKGKRLDTAEAVLWKAVLNGESWAVCFYLKTQGKSRGYVERQEVTGKDGGAIRAGGKDLTDDELAAIAAKGKTASAG